MSRVFVPRSLEEFWKVRAGLPEALIYAGGTDLLVRLRNSPAAPSAFICLERIAELKEVRDCGGEISIGACATHAALLADQLVCRCFPVLAKALQCLGSPPVRNMGTIGGNICTASPAGDCLPPLYVLGAELEILSARGQRRIALEDFILGPGKTRLQEGEILAGILLPKDGRSNRHHFEKVGQRNALAIAVVSLAALLQVSEAGVIERARLAWGSVAPTVVRARGVEEALTGEPLTEAALRNVMPLVRKAISPIDDIRAAAAYRSEVAGNLLLRLLETVDEDIRPC